MLSRFSQFRSVQRLHRSFATLSSSTSTLAKPAPVRFAPFSPSAGLLSSSTTGANTRAFTTATEDFKPLADYEALYQESISNPEKFWAGMGERLDWEKSPPAPVREVDIDNGAYSFYKGGKLNASVNCVDRHLATKANQTAILWESDELGQHEHITYQQLHDGVCRIANVLKAQGVKKGDVVTIYMPAIPTTIMTMLACARLGAIHSIVFAGFSPSALAQRINDAKSTVVVTANEGVRGGRAIPLKATTDEALKDCPDVTSVLVAFRTDGKVEMGEKDVNLNEAMAAAEPHCEPVMVDAEDPLFLLYTSGSTGNPKGLVHTTGGYLVNASLSHEHVFDYREGDVYACVADVGWITGHTYVVYGPLANGGTTTMFESIPTYPDYSRYWDMVQRHKITQLYTAPTAIRLLLKGGDKPLEGYDLSSLRVLGTVGEPIGKEAWDWYSEKVGGGKCTIVDTWWQTETGSVMMTPFPGEVTKPGYCMRPVYGVEPVLIDELTLEELEGNDVTGALAIRNPTPSFARTILDDNERFVKTYYKEIPGYYLTGDRAIRDKDGHYQITGRTDDVLNVSGHRLGTAEIESALTMCSSIAEAAVVGIPHDIKGEGIFAFVTLKDGVEEGDALLADIKKTIRKEIGALAQPDGLVFVPGLPKTSSGKIMRRILRKIARNDVEELGDTSTLADPSVVDTIIALTKAKRA